MPDSDFPAAARQLGFDLDSLALKRFDAYRSLIIESAPRFNLTAVREPAAIDERLFLDALALGRILVDRALLADGSRVLDIGSGAGLPGLPLRIACPGVDLTLLDAHAKRCAFLRNVAAELALDRVVVVQGRAEDCARDPALRGGYDLVVARAVAPLPVLVEYALPFLRLGGHLAATKGASAAREASESERAIAEVGGGNVGIIAYELPGGSVSNVVLISKVQPTSDRYPRRTGIPSKRPLA